MDEIIEDSKSVKLEEVVEKALQESARPDIFNFCKIYKYWKVIIGDPLYDKTAPLKLDGKTLYILVEDAAYSQELSYFAQNIIDLIASQEICGEGAVTKVAFRVGKPSRRETQAAESIKHKPNPPQPSTECVKQAEKVSAKLKDPELKKVFARYMARVVSKKQSKNEK